MLKWSPQATGLLFLALLTLAATLSVYACS